MDIKYINQRAKISNQQSSIIKRLQMYSLGSQSLAAFSGVLGQAAICSASIISLNLDGPLVGASYVPGTTATQRVTLQYRIDLSLNDTNDVLDFYVGRGYLSIRGLSGADMVSRGNPPFKYPKFYAYGDVINGVGRTLGNSNAGSKFDTVYTGKLGPWTSDRVGAFGFVSGEDQFGYFNVSWIASISQLTILGGKFQTVPNSGIVVTSVNAVPEPSEYAVALGLGALGLAYYRRRPGNKIRPKNN